MDIVEKPCLAVGEYAGTMQDIVQAVVTLNAIVGREHRIKSGGAKPGSRRLDIRCYDASCKFQISARYRQSTKYSGNYINTCNTNHTCTNTIARQRNYKSTFLSNTAPIINDFIPSSGRQGGNANQLIAIAKKQGANLTKSQAYKVINKRRNDVDHMFAEYRFMRSLVLWMQKADKDGVYDISLKNIMIDGEQHLEFQRAIFIPSSSCKVWTHYTRHLTCDAAHLYKNESGQYLVLCTYDASRHVVPLAFAVISGGETAEAWSWFLRICLRKFRGTITLTSDAAKGLESQAVSDVLKEYGIRKCRCAWHMLEKDLNPTPSRQVMEYLWSAVRARTKDYYVSIIRKAKEIDDHAATWLDDRKDECCTHVLLEEGIIRLGVVTSNSSEQANGSFRPARNGHVLVNKHEMKHPLVTSECL